MKNKTFLSAEGGLNILQMCQRKNKVIKKAIQIMLCLFTGSLLFSLPAFAGEMSNQELMQELKATQKRLELLEAKLQSMSKEPKIKGDHHKGSSVGVKGLADRVRRLENKSEEHPLLGTWAQKITLSGLIEVEASYEHADFADSGTPDTDSSDIALATVELGIDADITKHVGGHLLFKWEDGDSSVDVDEGFIIIDGEDVIPLYLNAGKMYLPFGRFESHFISDPLTLEIGEINEGAAKIGYVHNRAEVCLGAFNGDVDEVGDDNHIDDFVVSVTVTPDISEKFDLAFGVSYISNIGDSDGLEGEITGAGTVKNDVPGLGIFLSLGFQDRYFVELEYVGATDDFQAGELKFDNGQAFKPVTWNIEFSFLPVQALEIAVRYEGGDDLGDDFLPDERYGGAVSYTLFDNTTLAAEYLHASFENKDESDICTVQLGIEF